MKIENPPCILSRSDQDSEQLVTDEGRFRVPAPRSSFEDAQGVLKRAVAQLKVGDQSEEESRDLAAIFYEEFVRMAYEKGITYHYPISDEIKLEYALVNNPKIQQNSNCGCRSHPRGSPHNTLVGCTTRSAPIGRPTRRIAQGNGRRARKRYPRHNPHRIILGAEREVFALEGMYASALLARMEASPRCSWTSRPPRAPHLAHACARSYPHAVGRAKTATASLADHVKDYRVKIIEDDHLRESVLLAAMRAALDCEQLRFNSAIASLGRSAPQSEAP